MSLICPRVRVVSLATLAQPQRTAPSSEFRGGRPLLQLIWTQVGYLWLLCQRLLILQVPLLVILVLSAIWRAASLSILLESVALATLQKRFKVQWWICIPCLNLLFKVIHFNFKLDNPLLLWQGYNRQKQLLFDAYRLRHIICHF